MTEGHEPGNRGDDRACSYVDISSMYSGLGRVREVAKRDSQTQFTSLFHHLSEDLLIQGYKALNPKATPGVDGETWDDYGTDYVNRIRDLHKRLHRGAYRAKPSKRMYLDKPDGRKRPIGIAALEDKIVQQATVWVLEAIYEVDFLGFSYGFRPGRSQHNALDALYMAITTKRVNWVLDADVKSFFDTLSHEWLVKFLEHRIGDPRLLRLIQKWLRAGVSDEGEWSSTTVGTPQGAVISPILANIYLHYVLDLWVEQWRNRHARGEVYIVRYADDFVMGFQYQEEAERFRRELEKRFQAYGLTLHEQKTRLLEFGRYADKNRRDKGSGKPETFDFLGFKHICSKRRSDGGYKLTRKSIPSRLRDKVKAIRRTLMQHRHAPVPKIGVWLRSVVRGFFQYHAVPGNTQSLNNFRRLVISAWRHALRRRSQKDRFKWTRIFRLADRWLPHPRVIHPYPSQRFRV